MPWGYSAARTWAIPITLAGSPGPRSLSASGVDLVLSYQADP